MVYAQPDQRFPWRPRLNPEDPETLEQIEQDPSVIPIVTDGRFPNEAEALRREYGTGLYHIDISRDGAPEPTDEEKKHFRKMAGMADYRLFWGNDTPYRQLLRAKNLYEWLLSWGLPPKS